MYRLAENGNAGQVCPYLGLRDDPETALYYPSPLNHCYRAKPATPVKSEYQGTCCLTATHSECRVYQKDPGFPLPPDLRNRQHGSAQRKRSKVRLWVILFVLVVIGLMVWQSLSSGLLRFAGWEHSNGETVPVLLTETGDPTPPVAPTLVQDTSTPTFLPPSPSPTWTSTPTVVRFHALETPIGIEHQFIIHRVLLGESLTLISTHYGTTDKAIQLVNYYIQIPLWVDSLVIIPVNQTDVSGLPVFEAYRVEKDTPVEELAQQLMVDPAVLKYYNDLKDGQVLAADEWVLVPHTGAATPRTY
jgi:hypothetical protein